MRCMRAGLTEPVLDVDRIELGYPDALALMRDLKAIGAHNVTAGRPRGSPGRARLKRMRTPTRLFAARRRLPATYEVIYGASWGAQRRTAATPPSGRGAHRAGSIGRRTAGRR